MKKIGFLTSEMHPHLITDDLVVFPFLHEKGIDAQAVIWDQVTDQELKKFDGLIFRSCWNYHLKFSDFENFLCRLHALGIPCHNPLDLVTWNLNKKHIIEFERLVFDNQIVVPKTKYLSMGQTISELELQKLMTELDPQKTDFIVVKPAVSLNGFETVLMPTTPIDKIVNTANRLLQDRSMLIQQYVPEIKTAGEVSLIYFNGIFSHAVRKLAATGEFRIHEEYGGTRQPLQPSQQAVDYGHFILRQLNRKLLYARVDYVETKQGPIMIELEITDPMLFLLNDIKAPQRFADAIVNKFTQTQ